MLKIITKLLTVILGYGRFWVGSCSVAPSSESFSQLTCLTRKWRTEYKKTFCEAMNSAKFSLKMFKSDDIFHKTFQSWVWNSFQLWNAISLLKMRKTALEKASFDIFTIPCERWDIFHIANLLKIFLRGHSRQIFFFPKYWHFKHLS